MPTFDAYLASFFCSQKCLSLRNFNSMIALLAGLNQPAIRRLKRTWEQVNQRNMQLLEVIEWTMDSGKNFNNYRTTLQAVSPPCMPFFGLSVRCSRREQPIKQIE
jgi:son of sevenless-like protein